MKIVHNTKKHLIIRDDSWKLALFLIFWAILISYLLLKKFHTLDTIEITVSLVSILSLFFFSYLARKKSYMKFDAKRQRVTWGKDALFKRTEGQFKFSEIKKVINRHKQDTEGTTYRVEVLLNKNERIPIVEHYSTIERQEEVALEIRKWLAHNAIEKINPSDTGEDINHNFP